MVEIKTKHRTKTTTVNTPQLISWQKYVLFLLIQCVLVLTVLCLATVFMYWLSTQYFFDKLLYHKSPWYGYATREQNWSVIATEKELHPSLHNRVSDLIELINWQKQHPLPNEPENFILKSTTATDTKKAPFTVLIIGDSVVFGAGVLTPMRFGDQLERMLNKRTPSRVITLAQPGDDVLDNLIKAIQGYNYYRPDLIIFTLYHNDLAEIQGEKYPDHKVVEQSLKSKCPGELTVPAIDWLRQANHNEKIWHDVNYVATVDPTKANICYFKESVKMLQKIPIPVIYFTLNTYFEYEDPVYTSFRETVNTNGGTIVSYNTKNVMHTFHPVSEKESHPSAATHAGFAQVMGTYILNHKSIDEMRQCYGRR